MNKITLLVIQFIVKLRRLVHCRWLQNSRASFNDIILQEFNNGAPTKEALQSTLRKKMKSKNISIAIDLKSGIYSDEVYTCDLSYDYIRINAEYTT